MTLRGCIFFSLFLFSKVIIKADNKPDSLLKLIQRTKVDTIKIDAYFQLYLNYKDRYPDSALYYNDFAIALAEKIKDEKRLLQNHISTAIIKRKQGKSLESVDILLALLAKPSINKYPKHLASIYSALGNSYNDLFDFNKSLTYHFKALNQYEQMKDSSGIAASIGNIGETYRDLSQLDKALEYQNKSRNIWIALKNKKAESMSLNNIANIYIKTKKVPEALEMFRRSLVLKKETNDLIGSGIVFNNIGNCYYFLKQFDSCIFYYQKSLGLQRDINNKPGICLAQSNIGKALYETGKTKECIPPLLEALEIAKATKNLRISFGACVFLGQAYGKLKDPEKCKEYLTKALSLQDSLTKYEKDRALEEHAVKYTYSKKALADSIRIAEEKKVLAAQMKTEETKKYALYGGLSIVLLFSGFLFNRFRVIQKQKKLIEIKNEETEKQKAIIEESRKEIIDSIHYAKRIQTALITNEKYIDKSIERLTNTK